MSAKELLRVVHDKWGGEVVIRLTQRDNEMCLDVACPNQFAIAPKNDGGGVQRIVDKINTWGASQLLLDRIECCVTKLVCDLPTQDDIVMGDEVDDDVVSIPLGVDVVVRSVEFEL